MKYTENDITVGTKLICTKSNIIWWSVGKLYEVKLNEAKEALEILKEFK